MATKEPRLGLYLVNSQTLIDTTTDEVTSTHKTYLVIAPSATQAAEYVAFQPNKQYENVPEDGVGRLGDYDPGIEGHRMVARLATAHRNGVILLVEEVDA